MFNLPCRIPRLAFAGNTLRGAFVSAKSEGFDRYEYAGKWEPTGSGRIYYFVIGRND